jgi:hypothetical protein
LHRFSTSDVPNDLLHFSPVSINSLAWPSIFLFDNDLTVSVKSDYYQISGLRGSKKFLPRRSEPHSELLYF